MAVFLYGLSALHAIFLYSRGFRHHNRITYALLGLGFVFHTTAMLQRGFSLSRCPIHNLYEATLFVEWTMLAAYLAVGLWDRLRFLGAFASPLFFAIGVFALMPGLDIHHGSRPQFSGGWLSLHVALFALSYGAFGLSSVAGLMYLFQERDLKFHKLRAMQSLMPPIQRLETTAGRLLLAGFLLLTLALVVSAIWMQRAGRSFTADPKIVWSIFVWALYCGLVVMRWMFSQRGRRFAWGAIAGFVFVLLTFWGSSLLSPLHSP